MVNAQDFLRLALWPAHFPFLESSYFTHLPSIHISPDSISSIVPRGKVLQNAHHTLTETLSTGPDALDWVTVRTEACDNCKTICAKSTQISNCNIIFKIFYFIQLYSLQNIGYIPSVV